MTAHAELSSVSTAVEELAERVSHITDSLEGAEREALTPELYEVERHLQAARRRLQRVLGPAT